MSKVGTIERTNPLPAGQYWVDVFGLNIPKADAWFKAFSGLGVHVDATQHFESPEVSSVRNWYKFSYAPVGGTIVTWDTSLGFPTVADSSIQSSDDTVTKPDLDLDPLDQLSNWVNSVEQKLGGSLGAAASIIPFAMLAGAGYLGYVLLFSGNTVRKVKQWNKKSKTK